jgi:hypothetical protein
MRDWIALLAVALAVGLLGACGDDSDGESGETTESARFEIVGTWEGELSQRGLEPFEVRAEIGDLDDPAANTVHYTGIDCGGNWTFLGLEGSAYRFREVIDRGAGGDCKGMGVVTLRPQSEDTLVYRFQGGGVFSEGTLTRQG